MEIAQRLAGFSLGAADNMRRAMGKKKKDVLQQQFAGFEAGMMERGFNKPAIKTLWDVLVPFTEYAFNKSHSAAYGVVTYWTAYLKANYPAEFMAALLQSTKGDKTKLALYLNECRRMGINVLQPDVNSSAAKFTAVGTDIRFGLSGIRNVGENVVDAIVQARQDKPFKSFIDFLDRVPAVVCNKRTIESLIKAGAFDSVEPARKTLMLIHEPAIDEVIAVKRQEAEGIFDLFSGFGNATPASGVTIKVPNVPDWDKSTRLTFEREMLGLYVSDHPLSGLEQVLAQAADTSITELKQSATELDDNGNRADTSGFRDNQKVKVAGLITNLAVKMSKNGNQYAILELEDIVGSSVEISFFGDSYIKFGPALKQDAIVAITGKIQRRDDVITLRADDLSLPDTSVIADAPISLTISQNRLNEPTLSKLRGILFDHQGSSPVRVVVVQNDGVQTVIEAGERIKVNKTSALYSDLQAALGVNCLQRGSVV
jgi:DNA polymerase-3 subunit alpha